MALSMLTPLLAFIFFVGAIYLSTSTMLEKRYQRAIELIQQGKWYQAEHALKMVSNYHDVPVLEKYARAMVKLDLAGEPIKEQDYQEILEILHQIPDQYQGNFKEEIAQFKRSLLEQSGVEHWALQYERGPYDGVKLVKVGNRHIYVELETLQPPFGDIPVEK